MVVFIMLVASHLEHVREVIRWGVTLERFRAGHFTCKNTDWEKWREPIRKVDPETTDWALHTRILVRIEPSHFLTAAECWSIAGSVRWCSQSGISLQRFFSFSFFFSRRWPEFFPSSRRVSNLFLCLSIYVFLFTCHHAVVVVVFTLTGFVLKRLFASVATPCFELFALVLHRLWSTIVSSWGIVTPPFSV